MKLKLIFMSLAFVLIANVANAYSIRYYNKDSKTHKMEVKTNGSTKSVEFKASTTSTASIQTSASEVEIKTKCGWIKVKNGAKITIKDGCIKIG